VLMEELSFGLYRRWRDLGKMFLLAFLENFGYRQVTLVMRLVASFEYLLGRQHWGRHVRENFNNEKGAAHTAGGDNES
jgi:biofilm PGA synthesis N-glycosyltransferase PgaC